ncbi:MAG: Lrp/AsnC family transcriptional regulator [Gammaproteobacteria bacterium]
MVATSVQEIDRRLIAAIQGGLPLVAEPYRAVAEEIGISEQEVLDRLRALRDEGIIKRMGVVVRHHELGYRANAMVVWDVPDDRVSALGECMGKFDFVTLCYRRRRYLPEWPYNLYCMIHGSDRAQVLAHVAQLVEQCDLGDISHEVLFSRRRFKQNGARYLRG